MVSFKRKLRAAVPDEEVSVGSLEDSTFFEEDDRLLQLDLEKTRKMNLKRRGLLPTIPPNFDDDVLEDLGAGNTTTGPTLNAITISDTTEFIEKLKRLQNTTAATTTTDEVLPTEVIDTESFQESPRSGYPLQLVSNSQMISESSPSVPTLLGHELDVMRIHSSVGPLVRQLTSRGLIQLRNSNMTSATSEEIFDTTVTYKDQYGRILNAKDAYRLLSHRFHGKAPGKMKTDKYLKKFNLEKEARKNI